MTTKMTKIIRKEIGISENLALEIESEYQKADVYLRVVGMGGDGVADPAFGNIQLQFK